MAGRKTTQYKPKGIPTRIKAVSRCAIKIRDNFYTIETEEERSLPEEGSVNIELEFETLFNELNNITDAQIQDIIKTFDKRRG